jgi:APA family basic amino acid/polyamine antiporter
MLSRAIAPDKLFPVRFATLNRQGSPTFSLTVAASIASVLIVMNYTKGLLAAFELLIVLSTLTTLLPYAASALSEFVLQRRDVALGGTFNFRAMTVAFGALAFSIFAIVGSGLEVAAYGLVLLAAGFPIYVWQKRSEP